MADPWSLESLGLVDDPLSVPLSYPGVMPPGSGLLIGRRFLPIRMAPEARLGDAEVAGESLDQVLLEASAVPMDDRRPVVAVGSNASPAQLCRKFDGQGIRAVLPLLTCTVVGVAAGVSAHVNRHGYVPAAPMETPGKSTQLFVLWLDAAQLAGLDATEPNYRRVLLPEQFTVTAPSGKSLQADVYVGRWGCLTGPDRTPMPLPEQRTLIHELLERLPGLRELFGPTAETFVAAAADERVRQRAAEMFRQAGIVAPQRTLEAQTTLL